jgi:AraC family transcriptional activator of pobA
MLICYTSSPKHWQESPNLTSIKQLSSLINKRIIIEAKGELYLTDKTVKEIACELGYEDEYCFSRFFKVSNQLFSDAVGYAKEMA